MILVGLFAIGFAAGGTTVAVALLRGAPTRTPRISSLPPAPSHVRVAPRFESDVA